MSKARDNRKRNNRCNRYMTVYGWRVPVSGSQWRHWLMTGVVR